MLLVNASLQNQPKDLKQAIKRQRLFQGLIHHSDRGVQYCSHEYQSLLKEHQITPSTSRKGNPNDNVVAENFFSCLKCEKVYLNKFTTRREAELAVFRCIEGFYNRKRRHEALGRISPKESRACWERAYGLVGANNPSVGRYTVSRI